MPTRASPATQRIMNRIIFEAVDNSDDGCRCIGIIWKTNVRMQQRIPASSCCYVPISSCSLLSMFPIVRVWSRINIHWSTQQDFDWLRRLINFMNERSGESMFCRVSRNSHATYRTFSYAEPYININAFLEGKMHLCVRNTTRLKKRFNADFLVFIRSRYLV